MLTAKLFIPPLRLGLVPRPRLIELLNEGPTAKRKLTLVSASAGFGKTTLVVDWLKQIDLPAAWLSLDEADNGCSGHQVPRGGARQHPRTATPSDPA